MRRSSPNHRSTSRYGHVHTSSIDSVTSHVNRFTLTEDVSPSDASSSAASIGRINTLHAVDGIESPKSPSNSSRRLQDISKDRLNDPLGLALLYEPEKTPVADIVFVHGIGGSSQQTWTNDQDSSSFWPSEWLPEEPALVNARISSFGYTFQFSASNTNVFDVSGFAKELLANLRFKCGRGERSLNVGRVPLIFVAHSFGGLIAKKAYILGRTNTNVEFRTIAQAVSAFVFLSTPHSCIHLADALSRVLLVCVPRWSPRDRTPQIKSHASALEEINEQFRELASEIETVSFYETQPTFIGVKQHLILQKSDSIIGHSSDTGVPLNADHIGISKFSSPYDFNYGRVRDVLNRLVAKLGPTRPESPGDEAEQQSQQISRFLGNHEAPEDDHSFFAEKRVNGSCEWIQEHPATVSWLRETSEKPEILWCYGKPGSGKSVTTSSVIDSLIDQAQSCAYYYFRSGDQLKNNLVLFLLSIASQAALLLPEYRRKLCRLADEGFNVPKAGYKMLWKKLFVFTLFKSELLEPFYIVVDGLDELDLAKELLSKLFIDLADIRVPVRLLLVSRPTPEIESCIDRLSRRISLKSVALDSNELDLELYVSDEMESMLGDDVFKSQIKQQILAKADGNFLWVHLVVKEVLDCLTEDDVEFALKQVPQELEPLYCRMDTLLADTFRSRPNDRALGHMILIWATCSRYPLLLEELAEALQPEFSRILSMRQTVQKVCGEFVVVDKKSHISMMHASARDYLLSNEDLNYYIRPERGHQTILKKCLQSLASLKSNSRFTSFQPCSFLSYAAGSWPFHLNASCGYMDQDTLQGLVQVFQGPAVLDWIFILARSATLRTMVEASKALTSFLKLVDRLDRDRSPLVHRIKDKDLLQSWAHDLMRVVGKFGTQLVNYPRAIFNLIPAFCPKQSITYKQFAHGSSAAPIVVRGTANPDWDDCLSKFALTGDSMPQTIIAMDRYFAILTGDGIVHLFYSSTCEEARSFHCGEMILTLCFNAAADRLATYGRTKTKIWDSRTARHLFTIDNPRHTKALCMTFRMSDHDEESLLTFSEDQIIRTCAISSLSFTWEPFGHNLGQDVSHLQHANAPRKAHFSPEGGHIAVTYRGAHTSVWSLNGNRPQFISQCERRIGSYRGYQKLHTNYSDASAFCWNPMTGHLLGVFNDGCVFKWHPYDDDYTISDLRGSGIKCSADGKLFATSSGDGTLRIWDFDHFVPVYQLFYPWNIQDLDIDRNEARVYDLRDRYCNVWEPNALLRLLEIDDKVSDTQSSRGGSTMLSAASESFKQNTEPVTALTVGASGNTYAVGNDAGLATLHDFDGLVLTKLADGYMSIEHIAYCAQNDRVAVADLSLGVEVRSVVRDGDELEKTIMQSPLSSLSETDRIVQLLFNSDGSLLLVVTSTAIKIHSIEQSGSLIGIIPETRSYRWLNHPGDSSILLGFGTDHLRIIPWKQCLEVVTIRYEKLPDPNEMPPFLHLEARRPSQAYPISPSELQLVVTKVLVSADGKLVFFETWNSTRQAARRAECFLMELSQIEIGRNTQPVPVKRISSTLAKQLHIALGFIRIDEPTPSTHHRPSLTHGYSSRSSISRYQSGEQTFVYVDRDYWICSTTVGGDDTQPRPVSRHFFLPRDWQNAELEMATVTIDGHFLCPKNGDIAVVSNGFVEEWTD